jgi:hypothetical protein
MSDVYNRDMAIHWGEKMGIPDDMKDIPEVDMEINEDSWNSPAGEGLVETRRDNGRYKMLLRLGEATMDLDLGNLSPERGRELHKEAVEMIERAGSGASLSAETFIKIVGRRMEELAKDAAASESVH